MQAWRVAVAGVAALACLSLVDGPVVGRDGVPTALVDGSAPQRVPAAVATAFGKPVVGVRPVTRLPWQLIGCRQGSAGIRDDWAVEFGYATPDDLLLVYRGGDLRVVCRSTRDGLGWETQNAARERVNADEDGGNFSCGDICLAHAVVAVPQGAAWMVQDRGDYGLAHPVAGHASMLVTWRAPFVPNGLPHGTRLTFFDASATVLQTRLLGDPPPQAQARGQRSAA